MGFLALPETTLGFYFLNWFPSLLNWLVFLLVHPLTGYFHIISGYLTGRKCSNWLQVTGSFLLNRLVKAIAFSPDGRSLPR
jgi:succinate dehydrogenase hydrophobic anchor subunit